MSENLCSPVYKTALYITYTLAVASDSPWRGRIQMAGERRYPGVTIKDAFVVHMIYGHLLDEDGLVHSLFVKGNQEALGQLYVNYFRAAASLLPKEWNHSNSVLTTPAGFAGLMAVAKDIFRVCRKKNDTLSHEMCRPAGHKLSGCPVGYMSYDSLRGAMFMLVTLDGKLWEEGMTGRDIYRKLRSVLE